MKHRNMLFVALMVTCLALSSSTAFAGGFRGSSGGSRSSGGTKPSSGGGSKISGGTKPSNSGGSKTTGSGGTKPTLKAPSSGSKPLPKPITTYVPKTPPPRLTSPTSRPRYVPSNANYSRDYGMVSTGRYRMGGRSYYYSDPYGPSYFGFWNSPLSYLWVYSWLDGDNNYPPPPESDNQVDTSLLSFMQVIEAIQEQTAGKE